MATKKQKRERALAKREAFMAEVKADGLKAQEEHKEWERAQSRAIKQEAAKINARNEEILQRAYSGRTKTLADHFEDEEFARALSFAHAMAVGKVLE